MGADKYRSHNEKMRSSLDSGDYRSAQREAGNFVGDLIGDIFNGIGGFFSSRREAKERERERQEQLRREREAAERRRKIFKIFFIVILVTGIGTGGFFLVKSIFFGKATPVVEETINIIEAEPVIAVPETSETEDIDFTDIEPVDKKNIFKRAYEILIEKSISIKNFFVNELFPKIFYIQHSAGLLYIIGYSFIALWLGLSGVFLLVFFGKLVIALLGRKNWSKAGSSFISSFILLASDIILYFAFRETLERQITGTLFEKILTIISFALFVFANITVILMLFARSKKAKWGTVIKMIITIVIIYISVILLGGNS